MAQRSSEDSSFAFKASSIVALAIVGMLVLAGLRAFLAFGEREALSNLSRAELLRLFVIGGRLDASGLSRLLYLPLLGSLVPGRRGKRLVSGAILGLTTFLALEVAFDVTFYGYFGARPNYLVFEHGMDPEVLQSIGRYLTLGMAASCAGLIGISLALQRGIRVSLGRIRGQLPNSFVIRLGFFLLSICLIEGVARGTLDHRPINPSIAFSSSNRVANEVASSGLFTIGYEGVHWLKGTSVQLSRHHVLLDETEVESRVRSLLADTGRFTGDSENPYVREIESENRPRPRNVVVIVMESFTSKLVGSLGGDPALSPEFDALVETGLLLENCYATGERTVQGLAGVLSSFPALPGVGAVRRPQTRGVFETLGSLLERRGYDTLFLYGGEGHFDHMAGFFRSNGFDRFLEESDFEDVSFRGTWGVSDEDVFRRANAEFQRRWQQGTPFLGTVLTVSLHTPWEFPKDRAPLLAEETPVPYGFERDELANFLYADFAIGEFMREALSLEYSRDTLFVFVGDHGVHLRGRQLLPSEEFRIPALFIGPGWLPASRISTATSQIDIAPTIMGLLGGDYRSPFFGHDLLKENAESLALLLYLKRDYGIRRGDRFTVLQSGKEPRAYELDSGDPEPLAELSPAHLEDARDAMAILQAAERLMDRGLYTVHVREGTDSITR